MSDPIVVTDPGSTPYPGACQPGPLQDTNSSGAMAGVVLSSTQLQPVALDASVSNNQDPAASAITTQNLKNLNPVKLDQSIVPAPDTSVLPGKAITITQMTFYRLSNPIQAAPTPWSVQTPPKSQGRPI